MRINRVFFLMSAVLSMVAGVAVAQTSEADTSKKSAVLFKIHDIVPVKNSDGDVTSCEYNVTFYNRSSVSVGGAIMDLSWNDSVVSEIIEQEKQKDSVENDVNINRARSVTERTTNKKLSTSIEVPAIAPSAQVVVTSTINTDRCFLLIEDVDYKVKNCRSSAESATGGRSKAGSCDALFMFVSPQDAQYYLEFKAVPVAEQRKSAESEFDKKKRRVNDNYRKTLGSLDGVNTTLSGIK
ncbi:MAG: hypothetical protein J6T72_02285 [Alphaproteobacteria bacterium]|nr:hypothetical protein [Alphaproteobacteria bacterium]